MEKLVQDSEHGLSTSTSQMSALRDAHDRMKSELEQSRVELKNIKNKNSVLEVSGDLRLVESEVSGE